MTVIAAFAIMLAFVACIVAGALTVHDIVDRMAHRRFIRKLRSSTGETD